MTDTTISLIDFKSLDIRLASFVRLNASAAAVLRPGTYSTSKSSILRIPLGTVQTYLNNWMDLSRQVNKVMACKDFHLSAI